MRADDATLVYEAPCLILVPAGTVHGFSWAENSCGQVLTLSLSYFQDLARRDRELAQVFAPPVALALPNGDLVPQTLARLAEELSWTAPGHGVAVEGLLLTLLVQALRLRHDATEAGSRPVGPQAALMARFRELVEARYRTHMLVDDYAAELRVHPRRLRAACLSLAGVSPVQLVQERRLLEAKRLLLYSNMTVAETAYYLGFQDPAYFTRVFTKVCKVSPRVYRRELQAPGMVVDYD